MGPGILFGNAAQQHDRFGQHQFGNRASVGVGRIEDRNTTLKRRVEIDLIGADTKAAYGIELLGSGENTLVELGAGANADEVDIADLLDQRSLVKRGRQTLEDRK